MNTKRNIDIIEKIEYVWVKAILENPIYLSETKTYLKTKKEDEVKQIIFDIDITKEMAEQGIPVKVPKCPFVKKFVDQEVLEYMGNEKAKELFEKWEKKVKKQQKELLKAQLNLSEKEQLAISAAIEAYKKIMNGE